MPIHLYLSPHLDDVVLSAGGCISHQVALGHRVVVATFCSADASPQKPLSQLAQVVHEKWNNSIEPYALRRFEDIEACSKLGAEWRHLGFFDAIYRQGAHAADHYVSFGQLFAPIPAWDSNLTERMADEIRKLLAEIRPTTIYGPLGVGSNVDHRHVLNALERLRDQVSVEVLLYEEQPYATGNYPSLMQDPVIDAVNRCPFTLEPKTLEIDFTRKRLALMCYRSQLKELFGSDLKGLSELERYSRTLLPSANPAERLWSVRH